MDYYKVEQELKKVARYSWNNKKQTDELDKKTQFIYSTFEYDNILKKCENLKLNSTETDYAVTRWYNFLSARATEDIFAENEYVEANTNKFDKLIDFSIKGITFDHKGTVFPNKYENSINFAKENKKSLIEWLYKNQSGQGRYHEGNRLFIVFYSDLMENWEVKREILLIKNAVENYLLNFEESQLIKIEINGKTILSDIIFLEK